MKKKKSLKNPRPIIKPPVKCVCCVAKPIKPITVYFNF